MKYEKVDQLLFKFLVRLPLNVRRLSNQKLAMKSEKVDQLLFRFLVRLPLNVRRLSNQKLAMKPLRDACLSCQCQPLPALVPRMILALVLLLLPMLVMMVAEALPFFDAAVKVHWTWARPWLKTRLLV